MSQAVAEPVPPRAPCDRCAEREGIGVIMTQGNVELPPEFRWLCGPCAMSGAWARILVIWLSESSGPIPDDLMPPKPHGPMLTAEEAFDVAVMRKIREHAFQAADATAFKIHIPAGQTLPWLKPQPKPGETQMTQGTTRKAMQRARRRAS